MLAPTCPLTNDALPPECAQRLVLRECVERRAREAQVGVCDTGRYRCRYVVWGRGPTLVMIPGLASDSLSFVMLMARLQAQLRCVSYDLPDGVNDGAQLLTYRHADLVGDLFCLLDHLRIDACFLYGMSLGSTIALSALHQQPARFQKPILQSGFARRAIAPAEVLLASFASHWPGRLGRLPLVRPILERYHEDFLEREPAVWDFFVSQTLACPLRAMATRVLMVHRLDLRPLLPAIQQPLLLMCGDRDPVVGKQCERELQEGLRFAARAEIENAGHTAHLTHPEVVCEAVLEWLGMRAAHPIAQF
jgi:pimeloyl-ACP methyl ester carboxylesterase